MPCSARILLLSYTHMKNILLIIAMSCALNVHAMGDGRTRRDEENRVKAYYAHFKKNVLPCEVQNYSDGDLERLFGNSFPYALMFQHRNLVGDACRARNQRVAIFLVNKPQCVLSDALFELVLRYVKAQESSEDTHKDIRPVLRSVLQRDISDAILGEVFIREMVLSSAFSTEPNTKFSEIEELVSTCRRPINAAMAAVHPSIALFKQVGLSTQPGAMAWLVEHGFPIHASDTVGKTLIFYAARNTQHHEPLQNLLQCNVDVNRRSRDGRTALHEAAEVQNLLGVMLLIKKGASLVVDNENETPLQLSIRIQSENRKPLSITTLANQQRLNTLLMDAQARDQHTQRMQAIQRIDAKLDTNLAEQRQIKAALAPISIRTQSLESTTNAMISHVQQIPALHAKVDQSIERTRSLRDMVESIDTMAWRIQQLQAIRAERLETFVYNTSTLKSSIMPLSNSQ